MPGSDGRGHHVRHRGPAFAEKNHARLIKAFAKVHEHDPRARLLIIGGGKLEDQLR